MKAIQGNRGHWQKTTGTVQRYSRLKGPLQRKHLTELWKMRRSQPREEENTKEGFRQKGQHLQFESWRVFIQEAERWHGCGTGTKRTKSLGLEWSERQGPNVHCSPLPGEWVWPQGSKESMRIFKIHSMIFKWFWFLSGLQIREWQFCNQDP